MNAPAQPVPQVMPCVLPAVIFEALLKAEAALGPVVKATNADNPERHYGYMEADKVVSEGKKAFRAAGIKLLWSGPHCVEVGPLVVARRRAWVKDISSGVEAALGDYEWPLPKRRDLDESQAMSAALTMSSARCYRELMEMVGVGAAVEESDAPKVRPAPPIRQGGKKHTAGQAKAWAEVNGVSVAKDVSEKDEREAREEQLAAEAEERAKADPRFRDEAPLPDPPGLMEDEEDLVGDLTAPPAPAEKFDQPASGNSDTSSGGGCKTAPESTPQVTESASGATHSESSAGVAVAPPSEPPAPGPSDSLTEADWAPDDPLRPVAPLRPDSPPVGKAQPVLAKRSAEGRASKWAKAIKRAARKPALCAECHGQIKAKEDHWDGGSKRCCLACRERLESEAAGAGKEVA